MKCESCDIHEATAVIKVPIIIWIKDFNPATDIDKINIEEKPVCSECAYEIGEDMQKHF